MDGDSTGIGFQLSMYRMLDAVEKARELRAAANERSLSDYYLSQYNELARRFNGLWDAVREAMPKMDALEQRVQAQEQELRAKDAYIAALENQLRSMPGVKAFLKGEQ
ncbi:MAG: hypothetical protein ABI369_08355 [Acetobacteraceae bacterium]